MRLKINRGGKEQELQGRASRQVEGVYYVQEKVIQPMQFNNQVIMFDLRTQSGTPIALGGKARPNFLFFTRRSC